jgi:hypothetical protein
MESSKNSNLIKSLEQLFKNTPQTGSNLRSNRGEAVELESSELKAAKSLIQDYSRKVLRYEGEISKLNKKLQGSIDYIDEKPSKCPTCSKDLDENSCTERVTLPMGGDIITSICNRCGCKYAILDWGREESCQPDEYLEFKQEAAFEIGGIIEAFSEHREVLEQLLEKLKRVS